MKLDIRNVYGWRWYLRNDDEEKAHAMSCPDFRTPEEAEEHFNNCGFPGLKMISPEDHVHRNQTIIKAKQDISDLLHAFHDLMNGEKTEEAQEVYDRIRKYYVIHVYGQSTGT